MKELVDVLLLVVTGDVHEGDVLGEGTHAVLEVNEVQDQVGEEGELRVVLTLLDHNEIFLIELGLSEVLEDLGESDLVTVAEVIHILEELLLLRVRLVVITILSKRLLYHILAEDSGIIDSAGLEGSGIKHELSNRSLFHVLLIEGEEIGLQSGVTVLSSFNETLKHTSLSARIGGFVVVAVTILVLEDLGFDDVLKGFVGLILKTGLNEIVLLELELSLGGDGAIIEHISGNVVFGVGFEVSFEVVAVHLLLLGEASEEVGVVLGPSQAFSLEHALLSAFVILGVSKFPCGELLNLIENAIELANGFLNIVPGLIKILAIRSWQVDSVLSKLTIDFSV